MPSKIGWEAGKHKGITKGAQIILYFTNLQLQQIKERVARLLDEVGQLPYNYWFIFITDCFLLATSKLKIYASHYKKKITKIMRQH